MMRIKFWSQTHDNTQSSDADTHARNTEIEIGRPPKMFVRFAGMFPSKLRRRQKSSTAIYVFLIGSNFLNHWTLERHVTKAAQTASEKAKQKRDKEIGGANELPFPGCYLSFPVIFSLMLSGARKRSKCRVSFRVARYRTKTTLKALTSLFRRPRLKEFLWLFVVAGAFVKPGNEVS